MVKKIDSQRPASVGGNKAIEAGKPVGPAKVENVGQVGGVHGSSATQSAGKVERRLTAKRRAEILALVEEESEKLFSEGQIPSRKRKVVEGAVKMALDASIPETDEDEGT